jgi:hypothetical protein
MECDINKITFTYLFEDNIIRVFNCFKSPEIFNQTLKHAEEIDMKDGKYYDEIGTQVKFSWKKIFSVNFIVKQVIDNNYYKKLTFYANEVKPFNTLYTLNFHFYNNTIENSTLFVHEMIFDDELGMSLLGKNHDNREKIEMCQEIDRILKKKIDELYQYESIIINNKISRVWEEISDWNSLINLTPLIGDSVNYEGNKYEIGTIVNISDSIKNTYFILRLIKCEKFSNFQKSIIFECFNAYPKSPKQELHFEFIYCNENTTFVSFKHIFLEPVKYKHIKSISKNKIHILNEIKKKIEL